eukprot:CAMPEP_0170492266 /NCGR_PEP_ID=MMETSP0208-20121228/11946_1 /TAXON_ID=197538 /ORGANISM="Strombidium inclinatum, Strain S3" /LENGTH=150 /DNA_ID=CAMNT_0010767977 /DNA_START=479 /DNA_END=931 /DNA_ORIENTATION=-
MNHAEPTVLNMKKNIPGPGAYDPGVEINKYGVYSVSTISNSRAAAWSPSKQRFVDAQKHRTEVPGPGEYNASDYQGGVYVLSTFKNQGSIKISQDSARKFKNFRNKNQTPGPGSYLPPSEFGYLELYKHSPKTSHSPRSGRNKTSYAMSS